MQEPAETESATVFINRDHIISVTIRGNEIVVTTTANTQITIPASAPTVAKFADDLANDILSNFVSIAAQTRFRLRRGFLLR